VVSTRLHPLGDRVYDAVEGGLRGRDQLSHLDSPSVPGLALRFVYPEIIVELAEQLG
jgi:hypothetical protein